MNIFAKREHSDAAFMVQDDDDKTKDLAYVVDLDTGNVFPKMHRVAILSRGYWVEATGDDTPTPDQVSEIKRLREFVAGKVDGFE
jgi:hypothetical protein